jgi:hypothetical protein
MPDAPPVTTTVCSCISIGKPFAVAGAGVDVRRGRPLMSIAAVRNARVRRERPRALLRITDRSRRVVNRPARPHDLVIWCGLREPHLRLHTAF